MPSTLLFQYAKAALRQIEVRQLLNPRTPRQREALISVVFAAFTLEAFINEVGDDAAHSARTQPNIHPPSIGLLGSALGELKERGSIQMKYRLAKVLLDGQQYDQGTLTYQDFALLIDLRDAIAHVKGLELYETGPEGIVAVTQSPRIIERLRSKNILPEMGVPYPSSWLDLIATEAVARWACNSAGSMIRSLIDAMSGALAMRGGLVYDFFEISSTSWPVSESSDPSSEA